MLHIDKKELTFFFYNLNKIASRYLHNYAHRKKSKRIIKNTLYSSNSARDGICPADVFPGNPGPGTPISREFPGTREIYDI